MWLGIVRKYCLTFSTTTFYRFNTSQVFVVKKTLQQFFPHSLQRSVVISVKLVQRLSKQSFPFTSVYYAELNWVLYLDRRFMHSNLTPEGVQHICNSNLFGIKNANVIKSAPEIRNAYRLRKMEQHGMSEKCSEIPLTPHIESNVKGLSRIHVWNHTTELCRSPIFHSAYTLSWHSRRKHDIECA